ncbi:hypothetical protein THMIRHAS_16230 [Thiosulfatimonas sediminis]|uniref:Uncharacterized protein n=1 Tax=Thiosulfatimonas sediminis TaxID=2675054 RepID=A0A6F8PWA2_9GAMM|nr:hypothetical protein [Thiosulfatimonas sediminis]BBP46250.1 hypothetical protein THMIRHAS_16230 [Thiosulfatimonas sediminis]
MHKALQSVYSLLSAVALFSLNTSALAGNERYTENANWPKNAWQVDYEYDDFSEQVTHAQLIFIPENYGAQKAFFLRCQPYYTNFSVAFIEPRTAIMEDGKLHNNAPKFNQHGFVYSQERPIRFNVAGKKFHEDVDVGGQNRGISEWLKPTQLSLANNQLQMSFFASFAYDNMPSFARNTSNDFSRSLFTALKTALLKEQNVEFELQLPNENTARFELNGKRLKDFAPQAVLDFCLLKRQLSND